jgi:hypothetical protein
MERIYMSDSIIALIGVVLGWGLSQLTELVKHHFKTSNLKENITLELLDVEKILLDRAASAKKAANDFLEGAVIANLGSPVKTPVLDRYYIDVFPHYSNSQRQNIREIKDLITSFNERTELWMTQSLSASSQTTHIENTFNLIQLYRCALYAKVLLNEANKNGGKNEIGEDHPAFEEAYEEVKKLTMKLYGLDHLSTN